MVKIKALLVIVAVIIVYAVMVYSGINFILGG
jgi:hypothetical protein